MHPKLTSATISVLCIVKPQSADMRLYASSFDTILPGIESSPGKRFHMALPYTTRLMANNEEVF